jgi:hypothetical protein
MKSFSTLIFAVVLALTGCKPRETTLSGQMFIVTRDAENIKLGLIEVLLIEKDSAKEFIQKRQPAIDAEIASRQHEFELCNEIMTNTSDMDLPLEQPYGRTNYSALIQYREHLTAELQDAEINAPKLRQQADDSMLRYKAGYTDSSFEAHQLDDKAYVMEQDRDKILPAEIYLKTMDIERLEKEFSEAKAKLDAAPTAEIYFDNFSPNILQKTVTDADGKFLISYPRNKTFAIFAKAERLVGDKTERYYWLINAPSGIENAQVFLGNNNLVTVDPDGYFKIKPASQ